MPDDVYDAAVEFMRLSDHIRLLQCIGWPVTEAMFFAVCDCRYRYDRARQPTAADVVAKAMRDAAKYDPPRQMRRQVDAWHPATPG